jgi:hypothetical protein
LALPFLPYSLPNTQFQLACRSFNFIQGRDVVQRFFGDLALVGRVQSKNFRRAWAMQSISVTPSSKPALLSGS